MRTATRNLASRWAKRCVLVSLLTASGPALADGPVNGTLGSRPPLPLSAKGTTSPVQVNPFFQPDANTSIPPVQLTSGGKHKPTVRLIPIGAAIGLQAIDESNQKVLGRPAMSIEPVESSGIRFNPIVKSTHRDNAELVETEALPSTSILPAAANVVESPVSADEAVLVRPKPSAHSATSVASQPVRTADGPIDQPVIVEPRGLRPKVVDAKPSSPVTFRLDDRTDESKLNAEQAKTEQPKAQKPKLAARPQPTLAPRPEPTLAPMPEPTLAPMPEPTLAPMPEPTVKTSSDPILYSLSDVAGEAPLAQPPEVSGGTAFSLSDRTIRRDEQDVAKLNKPAARTKLVPVETSVPLSTVSLPEPIRVTQKVELLAAPMARVAPSSETDQAETPSATTRKPVPVVPIEVESLATLPQRLEPVVIDSPSIATENDLEAEMIELPIDDQIVEVIEQDLVQDLVQAIEPKVDERSLVNNGAAQPTAPAAEKPKSIGMLLQANAGRRAVKPKIDPVIVEETSSSALGVVMIQPDAAPLEVHAEPAPQVEANSQFESATKLESASKLELAPNAQTAPAQPIAAAEASASAVTVAPLPNESVDERPSESIAMYRSEPMMIDPTETSGDLVAAKRYRSPAAVKQVPVALSRSPMNWPAPVNPAVQPVQAISLQAKTAAADRIQFEGPLTQLPMARAKVRSLTVGETIEKFEVEDDSICQVLRSGPNELKLIGIQDGTTRLIVYAAASGSPAQSRGFEIQVRDGNTPVASPILEQCQRLNDSVMLVFPNCRVRLTVQRDRLVASGTCDSDETARQILRMVRKACLVPVEDQLVID